LTVTDKSTRATNRIVRVINNRVIMVANKVIKIIDCTDFIQEMGCRCMIIVFLHRVDYFINLNCSQGNM
jgi:hypothetical protein